MGVPVLISRFYKAANEYRRAIRLYLFSSVQELTSLSILGHEFAKANSLLRGTTAIRGGADTFVFLSHEILGKFRAFLFQEKGNRIRQIDQMRRIMRL